MRNDLDRHKRGDCVKWVLVLIAVVVLAVAVTAAITQGFTEWNPYGWFGNVENGGTELAETLSRL